MHKPIFIPYLKRSTVETYSVGKNTNLSTILQGVMNTICIIRNTLITIFSGFGTAAGNIEQKNNHPEHLAPGNAEQVLYTDTYTINSFAEENAPAEYLAGLAVYRPCNRLNTK